MVPEPRKDMLDEFDERLGLKPLDPVTAAGDAIELYREALTDGYGPIEAKGIAMQEVIDADLATDDVPAAPSVERAGLLQGFTREELEALGSAVWRSYDTNVYNFALVESALDKVRALLAAQPEGTGEPDDG